MKTKYTLSLFNATKKLPKNYNTLIVPEIERVCENILGDTARQKIYNYVIYYYNMGKLSGLLESIYIHSNTGTKRIHYQINPDSITLDIIQQ